MFYINIYIYIYIYIYILAGYIKRNVWLHWFSDLHYGETHAMNFATQ